MVCIIPHVFVCPLLAAGAVPDTAHDKVRFLNHHETLAVRQAEKRDVAGIMENLVYQVGGAFQSHPTLAAAVKVNAAEVIALFLKYFRDPVAEKNDSGYFFLLHNPEADMTGCHPFL